MKLEFTKGFFNAVYLPMLENKERVNVLWGGGGSGKSHFVVDKMIYKALKHPNRTILLSRKVQADIKDSIFQLVVEEIHRMKISHMVEISSYNLTIKFSNGSKFICKGLDDIERIKSITGVDDIVVEECTEISQEDFEQLNLRLRSSAPNQQIHMMFNPISKTNWVYRYFFEDGTPPNTMIIHSTYKDNRFLPEDYVASLLDYKRTNPLYYEVYALGNWGVLGKRVYTNWKKEKLNPAELMKDNPDLQLVIGLDFGFMADASTLAVSLVDSKKKKLYIIDEMYEKGLTNFDLADRIKEKGYAKSIITADSAEKKSIEELKILGIRRIKPAVKGNGSINAGISFLQGFEIIVDEKCQFAIGELEQYVYKRDKKTGLYLNEPVDDFNHILDALRYSVESIRRKNTKKLSKKMFGL